MGADKWHLGKRFQKRLVRKAEENTGQKDIEGLVPENPDLETYGLDATAREAQNEGYIYSRDPQNSTGRATVNELLEAMSEEMRGNKVFAGDGRDEATREYHARLDELDRVIADLGYDVQRDDPAEIKAAVEKHIQENYDREYSQQVETRAFKAWFAGSWPHWP